MNTSSHFRNKNVNFDNNNNIRPYENDEHRNNRNRRAHSRPYENRHNSQDTRGHSRSGDKDGHRRPMIIECYHCKKRGHSFRNCFSASRADKDRISANFDKFQSKRKRSL